MSALELVERDRVLWIRAPSSLSARGLSSSLAGDLVDVCDAIREREEPLACVVLASEGAPFFVAPPTSAAECDAAADGWGVAIHAVAELESPTVAMMGGDAIGAAWELALACDLRLGSATAHAGSPEVRWGRLPSAGGTQRLVRAVGPTLAIRLLLLGQILSADQALELGLLHRVAAPDELDACAAVFVAQIAAAAPLALAYTKEAARSSADLALDDGLRLEADFASLLQATSDRAEGIAAFIQRRPPNYLGR